MGSWAAIATYQRQGGGWGFAPDRRRLGRGPQAIALGEADRSACPSRSTLRGGPSSTRIKPAIARATARLSLVLGPAARTPRSGV